MKETKRTVNVSFEDTTTDYKINGAYTLKNNTTLTSVNATFTKATDNSYVGNAVVSLMSDGRRNETYNVPSAVADAIKNYFATLVTTISNSVTTN